MLKKFLTRPFLNLFLVCCLLITTELFPVYADMAEKNYKEQSLKAAFLLNFARFTLWPEEEIENNRPLIFLITFDPKSETGFDAISGEKLRGRDILVEYSSKNNIMKLDLIPDLIFITKTDNKHIDKIISRFGNSPVLTVSDVEGFAQKGGMIEMIIRNKSLHFIINYNAVKKSGLEMNYQMLKLADRVLNNEE